jgi:hypothetical protein
MHSFRFIHLMVVHHVVVDWSLHQQVPLVWQMMKTCNNILHTHTKRMLSNTKAKLELANIKQKNVDSCVSKALD